MEGVARISTIKAADDEHLDQIIEYYNVSDCTRRFLTCAHCCRPTSNRCTKKQVRARFSLVATLHHMRIVCAGFKNGFLLIDRDEVQKKFRLFVSFVEALEVSLRTFLSDLDLCF